MKLIEWCKWAFVKQDYVKVISPKHVFTMPKAQADATFGSKPRGCVLQVVQMTQRQYEKQGAFE